VKRRAQAGAALLAAMLTVTLVATFAAAALWHQWRSVEVEAADRSRVQATWILTGALDWARLILREDRSGAADHFGEPWAVPLQEARLSTFLAADQNNNTEAGDADNVFLSGEITDLQSRLNVLNLVQAGAVRTEWFETFRRLFEVLGLPQEQLGRLAENLRFAMDINVDNRNSALAPLQPQRVEQLVWLGLSPQTVAALEPYVTLLPDSNARVNLNTAPAEVIYAAVNRISLADAQRLVAERARQHFRTLQDAKALLPETAELSDAQAGVGSRFFEVRGRLRMDDVVIEERSIVRRDGLEVRTVSRERGTSTQFPPPSAANR
jgi:general secretion pathway protein K